MVNETKYPAKIDITYARPVTKPAHNYLPNNRDPALQKMPFKIYGDNFYQQKTTFESNTASAAVLATIDPYVTSTSKGNARVSRKNETSFELSFIQLRLIAAYICLLIF